jgi:hypothetical protein
LDEVADMMFLSRRMALWTQSAFWTTWKTTFLKSMKWRFKLRIHFLHPEFRLNTQGRSRVCIVLSRRMTLRSNNLPSGRLINDFCEFNETMYQDFERPYKQVFSLLSNEKSDYSKLSDSLCRRMALRIHNFPSGRLKNRLWSVRWSDDSRCRKAMRTHFQHPGYKKKRLERNRLRDVLNRRMKSLKWCFE